METTMNQFAPTDDEKSDSIHHARIRKLKDEPISTQDDKAFTAQEVQCAIEDMDRTKAPGEDGITSNILMIFFKSPP